MQWRGGQQQVDGAVGEHLRRVLIADGQGGRVRLPGHLGQYGRGQFDRLVRVPELKRDSLTVRACGAVHEHGSLLRHGRRIAALQRNPDPRQTLRKHSTFVHDYPIDYLIMMRMQQWLNKYKISCA